MLRRAFDIATGRKLQQFSRSVGTKPGKRSVALPLELNEILKKMSRRGRVFDARNLRKSFQPACVKVGLRVKTRAQSLAVQGLASSRL